MYYLRKITTNGQVSIPKVFIDLLQINDGDYVFIYVEGEKLIIRRFHPDSRLNQCIFRNGKLTIPIEIRKQFNITTITVLLVQLVIEDSKIVISPNSSDVSSRYLENQCGRLTQLEC
ncbi:MULTISPECIES: AbrB/MazE/SpoVT family DNA-binding domain-containing protein [Cytobacillus]|uniref:AbrB/MazE/SpoVT family DNA-binding domain-containing protein n=1 Tax=Cytobacillus horneckiae TaxID=549687 RepID=A0A2N0ZAL3_9BACI|nr:AbrB/MazE/SpoVT family DNA-binding domain-containing protein [Cytobacillus kochii]MCA1028859.1 AbrB/MazE/SpoVT family DNA-binding domain-containing protein [Cytobacillus kochii]NRG48386.1 AbrB/MazE/SpoVT family DNA-binding domain-containing protein [Bacillus sp. CRN 9]PKG26550.1 AbrB/MazE/SpoVT family DNA-binding domain-containing protein [Cytobacillus horneckiae]